MKKQQDKYDILKTYYGYDTFRDGQEELIDCLLNGQMCIRDRGKMHFEPARAHYGFEHMKPPLDYMREYDKKQVLAHPKAHGVGECEVEPVISTVDVKDSITSWIAEEAIDFLETRDTTRPFFLWTSFTKPHPPLSLIHI